VVDGMRAGYRDSIHRLDNSQPWECGEVTLPVNPLGELASGD